MSDRMGEDALLDAGCFLDRFDVDSIQCLSWKSHTYLANKSHILPVRLLLEKAQVGGYNIGESLALSPSVSARDRTRGTVSFNGQQLESFQLALAAIKHSDLKYLDLFDPMGAPITDEEADCFAAVAVTVKVTDLCFFADLTHPSPPAARVLLLTDEHLRERGRRQMWSLSVPRDLSEVGACAFSDEALLDYLYAPESGTRLRRVSISAFNASSLFVKKLINRAHQAADVGDIELAVEHLPLRSQQLDGLHLTENRWFASQFELLENGVHLALQFERVPTPPRRVRMMDEEEETDDKFRFRLWK